MSRQIALQTRSEALRRTKRGLNARQGMEGAKTLTEAQEVRRADTPNQGLSGRQEPRQLLQSLFARHRQLFGWLVVVDRRCYSDGGLGFSQTVSGCAQGAAGTVAARSFWGSGSKTRKGF